MKVDDKARELCLALLTDDSPPVAEVDPAPGAKDMEIPPPEETLEAFA